MAQRSVIPEKRMEGNGYNEGYNEMDLALDFVQTTSHQQQPRQSYLQADLQVQIMGVIDENERREGRDSEILLVITEDLEILCRTLEQQMEGKSVDEILRVRTHQLAINKILVLTHGKTDFRLVVAHFQIGKAYVDYGCYEQAINHLTIASTKITRLSDIKQTKLYNSCILTALGRCYYLTGGYEHGLEIVLRAYEIQGANSGGKGECVCKETLELLTLSYLKLGNRREAVRVIDKLVDTMTMQFVELEGLYRKLVVLVDAASECGQGESGQGRMGRPRQILQEFMKVFELILQKLDCVVVECDKQSLRQVLGGLLQELDLQRDITLVSGLIGDLGQVIRLLGEQIKRERILKFKVLVGEQGVTSALDQELKCFLREYQEERENVESFKRLTRAETIELYKLQANYCARFVDYQSQLVCLKKLEEIYMEEGQTGSRLDLLKVKRNLAMLYGQREMQKNSEQVLAEIRTLETQVYGGSSEAVRKTSRMIKLAQLSQGKAEEESLYRSAHSHTSHVSQSEQKRRGKSKLRKTTLINGSGGVAGKLGGNRLIL